jgi:hypothetical protein
MWRSILFLVLAAGCAVDTITDLERSGQPDDDPGSSFSRCSTGRKHSETANTPGMHAGLCAECM